MPGDFFDTNVLIYLVSNDAPKADRAEALLSAGGTISVQVLNEFANVARRKMAMEWAEIRDFLATLRALLSVEAVTLDMHGRGLALAERHGLSIYDAMIVAAALETDCERLFSEDMHAGMVVDGRLTIVNPFA
ncbi:MAG TPA: PIN domain-containing protein [Devosiaceae bacterium]|nr:PIN domain-containing protein [Devosiaceae bacterium]